MTLRGTASKMAESLAAPLGSTRLAGQSPPLVPAPGAMMADDLHARQGSTRHTKETPSALGR